MCADETGPPAEISECADCIASASAPAGTTEPGTERGVSREKETAVDLWAGAQARKQVRKQLRWVRSRELLRCRTRSLCPVQTTSRPSGAGARACHGCGRPAQPRPPARAKQQTKGRMRQRSKHEMQPEEEHRIHRLTNASASELAQSCACIRMDAGMHAAVAPARKCASRSEQWRRAKGRGEELYEQHRR
eukprot:4270272-Pleurochrysis_carterae.AAC.2